MALFIGLMSGTSVDGVDGVLAGLYPAQRPIVLAHVHRPFRAALRDELLALNLAGPNEIERAALAANAVALAYAEVVAALLARGGHRPADVAAIGAHGQTVRHRPGAADGTGFTVQLLNGALLAEHSGIDVVCDLRSRDVAAGGQGAPLVPALHAALFSREDADVAVLNLGGIANLTLLPRGGGTVTGFDCGPANLLLDLWCERHTGQPFDADGAWAAGGQICVSLLQRLLAEPYFAVPPPKSTGRDLFGAAWLDRVLATSPPGIAARDVQATLAALTVTATAEAVARHAPGTSRLLVGGGGAFNRHLMRSLQQALPRLQVSSTGAEGVPPDQLEALAFAWLAQARIERRPGNLPAVTGAAGPRVLGAVYPAA